MSSASPAPSNSPRSSMPSLAAVSSLASSELEALQRALSPRWNVYLQRAAEVESRKSKTPNAFPSATQTAFLLLSHIGHVLFGGAKGGGKSSALLAGGLQHVDFPEYKGFLFRRKFTDLEQPGALIPRSHEWLTRGPGGESWARALEPHWNGDTRQWRFPGGSVLKFGYLETRADAYNYQGTEGHYFGFDEAGLMDPWCIEYVAMNARRPESSTIPILFRYSANPGGPAHEYLYEKFIVLGSVDGWVFIPSSFLDNPGLDKVDYKRQLDAIADPVLRAQMRDGDWTVRDRTNSLVPEWTDEVALESTRDVERPRFFIPYVVGDLGSRDLTDWLFGYPHFEQDLLVVEDEWTKRDPSTHEMAVALLQKSVSLWGPRFSTEAADVEDLLDVVGRLGGSPDAKRAQRLERLLGRVFGNFRPRFLSDVDWRLVQDLKPYGIHLVPTAKDDSLGARNRARGRIGRGGVAISPRAQVLLRTLKTALWNEKRTDFARNEETGHADAWAALIYFNRNASFDENPQPKPPEHVVGRSILPPSKKQELPPRLRAFDGIFGRRK